MPTALSEVDSAVLKRWHADVSAWFSTHARELPWRDPDCTPYGILVSEIMLQQTPVVRVLPRWESWMSRWPRPADLAAAPTSEVLRAWDRLGYPRRALRLQEAARAIVERHGGEVPADEAALRALPGIGEYTAAAVASFAFGHRTTVLDTNIRRVLARAVDGRALPEPTLSRHEYRWARGLVPPERPDSVAWNAGLMELGALRCRARRPVCDDCPLAAECAWAAAGRPAPETRPRGQTWHGTDRQLRGGVLSILRAGPEPLPRTALQRGEASGPHSLPESQADALLALHRLDWDEERMAHILAGLLADGLLIERAGALLLPD